MNKRLTALLATLLVAITFVCNAAVTKSQLIGHWQTQIVENEAQMTMIIDFNADSTGAMKIDITAQGTNIGRITIPMTWSLSGNTISYNFKRDAASFKLSNQFRTSTGITKDQAAEFESQMAKQMSSEIGFGSEKNDVTSVTATKLVLTENDDATYTFTRIQ